MHLTLGLFFLINESEEIGEKQLSDVGSGGGKLAPKCTYPFTVGIGRRKLPTRIRISTRILKLYIYICIVFVFSESRGCICNECVHSVFIRVRVCPSCTAPLLYACYKTFFMLNSTEHDFQLLIKTEISTIKKFFPISFSDVVFIMLINVKMPTIVGILTFMSRINFVLS